ncbi:MAG: phosphatidylglycerophosphatase A [Verrucomicrobiota bacterium]
MNRLLLWSAQGFGIGRIPVAPGTFGSLLGIAWFLLLLLPRNPAVFFAGTAAGAAASVWLCGAGERILGRKDPPSVVMDEVAAVPFCFFGWAALLLSKHAALPGPDYFFSGNHAWLLVIGFAGFRFFDVAKPWPVRQSQSLPGGWGITVDDFLAAGYVNFLVLGAEALLV